MKKNQQLYFHMNSSHTKEVSHKNITPEMMETCFKHLPVPRTLPCLGSPSFSQLSHFTGWFLFELVSRRNLKIFSSPLKRIVQPLNVEAFPDGYFKLGWKEIEIHWRDGNGTFFVPAPKWRRRVSILHFAAVAASDPTGGWLQITFQVSVSVALLLLLLLLLPT